IRPGSTRVARCAQESAGTGTASSSSRRVQDEVPGMPDHARRGNIDHVVIGPCGVVVIKTKNLSGSVEAHSNAWFANGRRSRSVSKQVNRNAIAVREVLSRAHPQLNGSVPRFVERVAVFTNPSSRVTVDQAKTIIVRYSQLLDVIRELSDRKRVPYRVASR